MQQMKPDIDFLVAIWDRMKDVVETREGFTEFVHSVKDDGAFGSLLDKPFCDTLYDTVNLWYTFRNGAMKAKMIGKTEIGTHLRRLAAIIEMEHECVRQLERVLNENLLVADKNGL
jgi:hypothetical protein